MRRRPASRQAGVPVFEPDDSRAAGVRGVRGGDLSGRRNAVVGDELHQARLYCRIQSHGLECGNPQFNRSHDCFRSSAATRSSKSSSAISLPIVAKMYVNLHAFAVSSWPARASR